MFDSKLCIQLLANYNNDAKIRQYLGSFRNKMFLSTDDEDRILYEIEKELIAAKIMPLGGKDINLKSEEVIRWIMTSICPKIDENIVEGVVKTTNEILGQETSLKRDKYKKIADIVYKAYYKFLSS